MRLLRLIVLAATLLSLPVYGFAQAPRANDCEQMSDMHKADGQSGAHADKDCCKNDSAPSTPCKMPDGTACTQGCVADASARTGQTDRFVGLDSLLILPSHEVAAQRSLVRFTSHTADGLLRPPTLI